MTEGERNIGNNRARLLRAYSPEAWQVYELLDVSLEPSDLDSLYEFAAPQLQPGSKILDVGCRDGRHLIELVRRFGAQGVGVDPVPIHIARAREAVLAAGLQEKIEVAVGLVEDLTHPDGSFDFVWCRDVIEQVAALDRALEAMRRLVKTDGRILIYTVFETELISARESEMMSRSLGNVPANLVEEHVEEAFSRARLQVEKRTVIGTEWREHVEEHAGTVARSLLRLARLRRQRDELVERFGVDLVDHVEANLHWEPFLLLGKLSPTVYVLRRAG